MLWKCCTQCQQIWKTRQWPQDWKRSVFIPIPKKGNAKECSNYGTIVLYYCGQESLRRNGIALIVNERVWNAVLGCNLKNDRRISVRFQGQPFNITVIQVYTPTSNAEVEQFYDDWQDLLELTTTTKKDVLVIIGDWNATVGSQEIPGVTGKFGLEAQNEAGQKVNRVLPSECTGQSKHPLPTT